jgi:hypothetical protein
MKNYMILFIRLLVLSLVANSCNQTSLLEDITWSHCSDLGYSEITFSNNYMYDISSSSKYIFPYHLEGNELTVNYIGDTVSYKITFEDDSNITLSSKNANLKLKKINTILLPVGDYDRFNDDKQDSINDLYMEEFKMRLDLSDCPEPAPVDLNLDPGDTLWMDSIR